jgi:phosphoglycolate phosphatase
MIKTVIFDYNGTLVDDTKKMVDLFSNALEKTGMERVTLEEYREKFDLPMERLAANFNIPNNKVEEAKNNFVEEWRNFDGSTALFADTKDILEYLKNKNIKIIILTAYMQERLEKELRENDIEKYIDEIIYDGKKVEAIEKIEKNYNLNPKEIIVIGDAEHDVEAGKRIGAISIGFTNGYVTKERLAKVKPDYLINSLSEIKEIIEKN